METEYRQDDWRCRAQVSTLCSWMLYHTRIFLSSIITMLQLSGVLMNSNIKTRFIFFWSLAFLLKGWPEHGKA
jgi:hypothetical protein